jgi:uncharacterized OB-fold protein
MRTDDPVAFPFWEGARRGVLVVQRCNACGHHQFYPRPFCLACNADDLGWVECAGTGVVYSVTMVHVQLVPDLPPPYQVALVTLTEGPRLLANITGRPCRIGEAVRIAWRERADAPPFPAFRAADGA